LDDVARGHPLEPLEIEVEHPITIDTEARVQEPMQVDEDAASGGLVGRHHGLGGREPLAKLPAEGVAPFAQLDQLGRRFQVVDGERLSKIGDRSRDHDVELLVQRVLFGRGAAASMPSAPPIAGRVAPCSAASAQALSQYSSSAPSATRGGVAGGEISCEISPCSKRTTAPCNLARSTCGCLARTRVLSCGWSFLPKPHSCHAPAEVWTLNTSPHHLDALLRRQPWTAYDGARIGFIAYQTAWGLANLMTSIVFTFGDVEDDAATVRVGPFVLHVGYYEPAQVEAALRGLAGPELALLLPDHQIALLTDPTRSGGWQCFNGGSMPTLGWESEVVHWSGTNVQNIMEVEAYWNAVPRLPGASPRSFDGWRDATRWAVPFRARQREFGPGWSSLLDIHLPAYVRLQSTTIDESTGRFSVEVEARHRLEHLAVIIRHAIHRRELARLSPADFSRDQRSGYYRASVILSPESNSVLCDLILEGLQIERRPACVLPSPACVDAGTNLTESHMPVQPLAVLFIAANPSGTERLRLDREHRTILEAVRLSRHRDQLEVEIRQAATVHDLRRELLDRSYDVVHVSSHGEREGLILEGESGEEIQIPQHALARLFSLYAEPHGRLKCVVLNACWSVTTGTSTAMEVPVTIAMQGPVGDRAAIEFSRGFYDGLGAGLGFVEAYEQGCSCVALAASGADFRSVLHSSKDGKWISNPVQSIVPSFGTLGPICPLCGAEESSSESERCPNCDQTRQAFSASAYGRTQLHIKFNPFEYSPRDAAALIEAVCGEGSLFGLTGFIENGQIQFRTRLLVCRPQMTAYELRKGSEPVVGVKVKWGYSADSATAECDINWFSGEAHFYAVADDVGLHREFFDAIEPHLPHDAFMAWDAPAAG
jgi:hypothetical protein